MIVIGPGVGAGNINDRIRVGDGDADGGDERGMNTTRDVSQLAKALEMDLVSKKSDNEQGGGDEDDEGSGGFFVCNICLEMAMDPVLTCWVTCFVGVVFISCRMWIRVRKNVLSVRRK
ncbi:hypothetical protein Hanom_Chr12g01102331 [Helianthus anomalus]